LLAVNDFDLLPVLIDVSERDVLRMPVSLGVGVNVFVGVLLTERESDLV